MGRSCFQGIHYADDDVCSDGDITYENNIVRDSCQIAPVSTPENCRRLYLAQNDLQEMDTTCSKETLNEVENGNGVPYENGCEDFSDGDMLDITDHLIGTHNSLDTGIDCLNENSFTVNKKISDFDSTLEITQSTSLPASPIRRNYKCDSPSKNLREEILKTKCKHYSPIFKRKNKHSKEIGVDEEMTFSLDDIKIAHKFKDLESFQKAQLRHKLKKNKRKVREKSVPGSVGVRKFVMHNKAPLWNENSQVYQLDFGGRVTQESAKNFQIEFRGKQVMQFGRIDNNAYTLDFQYPFAAIQAFAVALANVTQRLK